MRRRDLFRLFGRTSRATSVSPQPPTPRTIEAVDTTDPAAGLASDRAGNRENSGLENPALSLAIVTHLNSLPELEREAFRNASNTLTDKNILDLVKTYDADHHGKSRHRPQAEALSRFLGLLDRFMGGITIAIQANPDVSAIVVGGVRLVIDLAIKFLEFFARLSEMLCRFGNLLGPLTEFAKASTREDLVLEALSNVYGDLLQFCKHAHEVFAEQGLRRKWISWRAFWQRLWLPFEEEFGKIELNMQHHLKVLELSAQALTLNATFDASRLDREKDRSMSCSIPDSRVTTLLILPIS